MRKMFCRNPVPYRATEPGESAESLLQRPFSVVEHGKPQRDHSSKVDWVALEPFYICSIPPQQSRYQHQCHCGRGGGGGGGG